MTYPNYFPQYIVDIVDPYEKIVWQRKYSEMYAEEYSNINSEWYGLKATMIGVTMLAITLFATIMTATRLEKGAFAVASTLLIGTVGTTASICTMVYYGWKGDEIARLSGILEAASLCDLKSFLMKPCCSKINRLHKNLRSQNEATTTDP